MRKAIGIVKEERKEERVKLMKDMQPLEVCVIEDNSIRNGHVVMRTANRNVFEVIDLSIMEEGYYWNKNPKFKVRPYTGDTITLKIG